MNVHVIDGTYEIFRYFFAAPEAGAVRGVLGSILGMIEGGATHIGVATDHVIESFRNDLYAGYKTSEGVPEKLMEQFVPLEEGLEQMGVKVWAMVKYEADDALASAAAKAASDQRVERVYICTPDKDLAQCVSGSRVVQVDRRQQIERNEDAVIAKFGVRPESIPDYLAVVGDSADGYPGMPGWGPKAASLTFSHYPHLEDIPRDWHKWDRSIRGAARLATVLFEQWEGALLYRTLATLVRDVPVFDDLEELRWKGPQPGFQKAYPSLWERAVRAAETRLSPTDCLG